ncbi:hypothetical protein LTR04_000912 [Oleoguttula sp. CCFEE 6159]|nr:hypothetical protein LTR04_000912 [Oleoguttula sp. CCFEE 6159]
MASAGELQTLLRFLSQDAKVPLSTAMAKVKELQNATYSPSALSKANVQRIKDIFLDEKLAKQIVSAAKRNTKKRTSEDDVTESPSKKKKFGSLMEEPLTPAELEESLALPAASVIENEISSTVLHTNRAPLVLAFAVVLLKYTMPEQPLSSRLSLAQAVVSVNSRSKAVNLGLGSGKSAEDEGWGQGQSIVKIMGREIKVLRRWGYEWQSEVVKTEAAQEVVKYEDAAEPDTHPPHEGDVPLWGLDLEALKKSNGPSAPGTQVSSVGGLPIYTAQSARAYLLKSFDHASSSKAESATQKKTTNATKIAEKEQALGMLLGALELLYLSWADVLDKAELDRRAWSWYVRVRPDVANGVAGWGGKGDVKLADVLGLRRSPAKSLPAS